MLGTIILRVNESKIKKLNLINNILLGSLGKCVSEDLYVIRNKRRNLVFETFVIDPDKDLG